MTICFLSVLPQVPVAENLTLPHADKVFHVGAYLLMSFWFLQFHLHNKSQILYVLTFFALSLLLELIQPLTGSRQFEVMDLVANGTGLVLGAMLARRLSISIFSWIETYLIIVLEHFSKK